VVRFVLNAILYAWTTSALCQASHRNVILSAVTLVTGW